MSRTPTDYTDSYANSQLDIALDYLQHGFSLFALPHKRKEARTSWKRLQAEKPSEAEVRKMFSGKSRNIAIVTGEASRLVVRDFDDRGKYEEWCANHPGLAAEIPTVATASGFHLYVAMDPIPRLRVSGVGSGELRGAGAYVVAPPSLHPSGVQYTWTIPLGDSLPLVTFDDLDLSHLASTLTEEYRRAQKVTEEYRSIQKPYREAARKASVDSTNFMGAVLKSLPINEGQREKKLFELARRLKPYGELSIDIQVCIFDSWWEQAKDIVSTKDYETSMSAFIRCMEIATTPLDDIIQACAERAKDKPAPSWSLKFNPKCQRLAGICRELQLIHGDGVFYISCRVAGTYCGTDYDTASKWLKLFVQLKKLDIVVKNTSARATRYRYIAAD